MPIPHDKCPLRVAKIRILLLLMQHKFSRHPNAASQVPIFQTQTFLHLIPAAWSTSDTGTLSPPVSGSAGRGTIVPPPAGATLSCSGMIVLLQKIFLLLFRGFGTYSEFDDEHLMHLVLLLPCLDYRKVTRMDFY